MPLLDLQLQRRAVEIGRIRLGYSTPGGNGGKKPHKSETFVFTSRSRDAVETIASVWGGEVRPWAEARGQWEVRTDVAEIPVVVPGGPAVLSQMYELWDRGTCVRRCDSQYDTVSEGPCPCAAANRRDCKPVSRLAVILTDIPGMGTWRLETRGENAARELAGSVELLIGLRDAGQMVPAVLRSETRKSGRNVYQVPTLTAVATFRELASGQMVGRPIAELLPPAPVPLAAIGAGPAPAARPVAAGPVLLALADIPDDLTMGAQIQEAPDANRLRELWNEVIRLGWQKSYGGAPFKTLIEHLTDRAATLGLPTTRTSA